MRPTGTTLLLLAAGLPVAALPSVLGGVGWTWSWVSFVGVVTTLLGFELLRLPGRRHVDLQVNSPPVVGVWPSRHRTRVVLPAPLGPTIPHRSPRWIRSVRSLNSTLSGPASVG